MNRILSALIAIGLSALVHAQQVTTVGDIVSKGGMKLSKEEVAAFYSSDREIEGISPSGTRKFYLTYRKDGTLSGRSTDTEGNRGYGLIGTWSINEKGQFCNNITTGSGSRDVTPNPPCSFRYSLGSVIYSATAEEPNTPVRLTCSPPALPM